MIEQTGQLQHRGIWIWFWRDHERDQVGFAFHADYQEHRTTYSAPLLEARTQALARQAVDAVLDREGERHSTDGPPRLIGVPFPQLGIGDLVLEWGGAVDTLWRVTWNPPDTQYHPDFCTRTLVCVAGDRLRERQAVTRRRDDETLVRVLAP